MASTGGLSADAAVGAPDGGTPRAVRLWWTAAVIAAVGYGSVLAAFALHGPSGAELTGRFAGQPAAKSLMAIFLAVAASFHPIARERRWLIAATLLSAAGDFFLAIPWWKPSFVCGLGAFLVAHLCFLGALLPLRGNTSRLRLMTVAVVVITFVAMLVRFWPKLVAEGLTVPVTIYMTVLAAMVSAALMAQLPTLWTALGAVFFAISDGMIGVGKFVLGSPALELPIWWAYAASMVLITAGFFFGRSPRN
ncbi:MAG: lysoplasmalogenase [Mycobacterium sp.]